MGHRHTDSDLGGPVTLDGDGKRLSIEGLPGGLPAPGRGHGRTPRDSDGLRYIGWDGENIIGEADASLVTIVRYTLAPEVYGSLLSQRRSGATSFHHFDALGSTDRLTDSSANTLISYSSPLASSLIWQEVAISKCSPVVGWLGPPKAGRHGGP
jgi:hypothetical protein